MGNNLRLMRVATLIMAPLCVVLSLPIAIYVGKSWWRLMLAALAW